MDTRDLAGSVKVAILVKSMDQAISDRILSSLGDSDRLLINKLISQMGAISPRLQEKVVAEFEEKILMAGSKGKKHDLVLLKDGKKEEKLDTREHKTLNAIQAMQPEQIYQLIKNEHPQTIAVVLANLKAETGGYVLGKLPESVKADVSLRVANLDKVVSGMIEEIDIIFEKLIKNKDEAVIQETDGVRRLAEMLNQMDSNSTDEILEEIEESDPELVEEIKQMMFVFEDLVMVDDRGLQKVLRNIESKELALALKAASDDVKNKIYQNMSKRATEILQEEVDALGAVRMDDVTRAQNQISRIVQTMERNGELIIQGRSGEEFIG